jgi:diguanylate cyclase (GGDEF)-like protein
MRFNNLNWSARGRARVYLFTTLGTLACIVVAFAIDSYSFETETWRWGENPWNNLIIPLVLAPPFFFYLLSKLRELAVAHHELMNVASTDSLTALLNRRAFTAMVEGYLRHVAEDHGEDKDPRRDPAGALLVIDVDHFKRVNDRFGHDSGDEALRVIAKTIKGVVRDIDLVGRLGGEEFSVFLPGLRAEGVNYVAERIRQQIGQAPFSPQGERYRLSASIGGAVFDGAASFSEIYRLADQQLYAAKRSGRDRVDISVMASPAAGQQLVLH